MTARKMLSGIDLSGQQAKNAADASAGTDLVTLQQLQAYVRGLDWKASARAASTANVNLANPGASVDGVALANGDRVLLKNQTTASQNGLYVWSGAASALVRTADADTGTLTSATAVYITEGTNNGDTMWVLTTDDPITVNTTALTFVQFGGGTTYTNGNGIVINSGVISAVVTPGGGLLLSGSGLAIDPAKVPLKYSATIGDGSTSSIAVTHNIGTRDVHVTIYDAISNAEVDVDVVHTSVNVVTLNFGTAPGNNSYRVVVLG